MKYRCRYALILIALFLISPLCLAQVPDPDRVQAVAVYSALQNANANLPDPTVNYNVTDPATITAMFSGIEAHTLRDCAKLEADNTAYLYVKYVDGTRDIFHIFVKWSHLSLNGQRGVCHYIEPSSQSLFEANLQP